MKAIALFQLLLFASQMFLISSREAELPDEVYTKWNIDLNDMLAFEKSFSGQDVENKKKNFVESQSHMDAEHLTIVKKLVLLEEQAKQYIRRYINLFLVKCSLQDVPETDQDIKINIEFFITKKDLLFLQSLSKDESTVGVNDQLQRLDSIFDRGLQMKVENLHETLWSFMCSLMESVIIPPSFFYSKIFYYVIVLSATLLLLLVFRLNNISNLSVMLVLFNSILILEGILDYLNELKEAEVEDNVMLMRAQNINPDVCDPGKQTYWSKIVGLFTEDECLKYHKTFVKSKVKEVSPLKSILDTYNAYVFQYLGRVLGSCIRVFSENLYDSCSGLLKGLIVSFSFFWIIPFIGILIFCLMKPRIRFSFFGAGLDIGFTNKNHTSLRNKFEAIEDRGVQEIQNRESSDVTTTTEKETDFSIEGEKSVESCWEMAEKGGNVEELAENLEPKRSLSDDVTTFRENVNEIIKNE